MARRRNRAIGWGGHLLDPDEVREAMSRAAAKLSAGTLKQRKSVELRVRIGNKALGLADRLRPPSVRCELCGWQGVKFRGVVAGGRSLAGVHCPRCGSLARHRLMYRALLRCPEGNLSLHFAPERWLTPAVAQRCSWIVTVDLEQPDVDCHANLESLPFREGSVSLIVCGDVLEHVERDTAGLEELHRVLTPTGTAILHVPILVSSTLEYGRADPLQHFHYRAYGPDVVQRMEAAGFRVDVATSRDLGASEADTLGLHPADAVFMLTRR